MSALQFVQTATDYQIIADRIYAAMESGNHAQARLVLKENEESFKADTDRIRHEVQVDYGIRL